VKVTFSALAALALAAAAVSTPETADAQGWQRVTTEQQFRDRIVDRRIVTSEGNTFTSHADGRVTGQWGGQPMIGGWQWHQGFWCRNVRVGQNPETGTALPARQRGLVLVPGLDPVGAVRGHFLLPERRAGLQVVHQELGRGKGVGAVRRGGGDHHDRLARSHRAVAVQDHRIAQTPAVAGLGLDRGQRRSVMPG
jgi:hypothetical protein